MIAADYCPGGRVAKAIENGQYERVLGEIKELDADYKIVNFECAVASEADKPIDKCGPNLRCSARSIDALKYAGFDCVTLANNHFYDYGDAGVSKTINKLEQEHIDYVGGGENIQEAGKTLFKRINDKTIAIINCCEHEFSIATESSGGANPIVPVAQWYAISDAKKKSDYVIVIIHGGHEHYELPSPRMVNSYRFFVDAGADAIINHHQHCLSGYEEYKGKPIFYGLGNFCFDWDYKELSNWHKGYMVKLELDGERIGYSIIPYYQCYGREGVSILKDASAKEAFDRKIAYLNNIIADPKQLAAEHEQYLKKQQAYCMSVLEPYRSKIFRTLYNKKMLPSMIKGSKKKLIGNYLSCESHYEKLLYAVKH